MDQSGGVYVHQKYKMMRSLTLTLDRVFSYSLQPEICAYHDHDLF